MKIFLAASCLILSTACVSTAEFDRDQAYTKCESISDKSSRDRCIADAIRKSERDRHEYSERINELNEAAEQRELDREIAGARKD